MEFIFRLLPEYAEFQSNLLPNKNKKTCHRKHVYGEYLNTYYFVFIFLTEYSF